jgi:AcrR family transcriptional regulator
VDGKPVAPSGRRERARQTRRRIIDAAIELFAGGYAAATMQAIADRAGVAVQTVYFNFGTKQALLKEAVDVVTAGDDAPVPMAARPWIQRLETETDPASFVRTWARESTTILRRQRPVFQALTEAAATDPDAADQLQASIQQRRNGMRTIVAIMDAKGFLRPGLSIDTASDIAFTLMSWQVLDSLVGTCQWPFPRWEEWLSNTLASQLTDTGKPARPAAPATAPAGRP